MTCEYINTLKAEFGKTITSEAANEQFDAIEAALGCLEDLASEINATHEVIHNWGTVNNTIVLDPSLGSLQFLTIEGDVEISIAKPEEADPNVIYLVIADGGSGRFNFPVGAVWSTDSRGASIDGVPWDSQGTGGDYGAVILSLYDGEGWLYVVFSRNDIDFTASSDTDDLYNWR